MNNESKLCFIVCATFEKEIKYILEKENFKNVEYLTFFASCDKPNLENKSLLKVLDKAKSKFDRICVLGVNSFHISDNYNNDNITFYHTSTCFELLLDTQMVEYFFSKGFYLLTPFRVDNFKNELIAQGFNEITAKDYFNESSKGIIILDTLIFPLDNNKP